MLIEETKNKSMLSKRSISMSIHTYKIVISKFTFIKRGFHNLKNDGIFWKTHERIPKGNKKGMLFV